jgi:hypothetical protein
VGIVLAEAPELEDSDLVLILTYLGKGPVAVSNEVMRSALHRLVPSREDEIMASFGQEYFEAGKAKGVAEGEAKALARLLKKRFGNVPARLHERIFSADLASLEVWFDRAMDAPDLQSIFGSNSYVRDDDAPGGAAMSGANVKPPTFGLSHLRSRLRTWIGRSLFTRRPLGPNSMSGMTGPRRFWARVPRM